MPPLKTTRADLRFAGSGITLTPTVIQNAAGESAIVDATWFMPGTLRDARAEFVAGHIPGAGFFAIDEVCDQTSDLPHMLASGPQFTQAMRALGVNSRSRVIV